MSLLILLYANLCNVSQRPGHSVDWIHDIFYKNHFIRTRGSDWLKFKNNLRTVDMFLVETLPNLVKSLGNKKIDICSLLGKDCERGQNAQWSVILDKCTEISSKYRRSVLFFNALSFCFDFSSFLKPLTEIRTT